jgi:hypothetical protein
MGQIEGPTRKIEVIPVEEPVQEPMPEPEPEKVPV